MITETQAAAFVSRTCAILDDEKFDDYVGLFSADGHYRITTYSPELRKDLTYLEVDRAGLAALLRNIPQHVRLAGRFMRHVNGLFFESAGDKEPVVVSTSVLVIHTDQNGESKLFAAARYRDTIELKGGGLSLKRREVRLDTRQFGAGSHLPI